MSRAKTKTAHPSLRHAPPARALVPGPAEPGFPRGRFLFHSSQPSFFPKTGSGFPEFPEVF